MSDALRLIPLGGFGEIGMNMCLLEYGEDRLLIDAGIAFPDEERLQSVDLLIPNFSYLRQHAERLLGIVLTHGHEDHIGGVPFLLRELDAPLYGTPLTLGLVGAKLSRHRLEATRLHTIQAGERFSIGPFDIEPFRVNHSIPDCVGLGLRTPAGLLVHSGDFKFDHTPVDGQVTDFSALARFGDEGVMLLISDTTNIERTGHTPSESVVGEAFSRLFARAPGRILVATFASQIHRIQQVIDVASRFGRRVLVSGRSMERNIAVAEELGYLRFPPEVRLTAGEATELPADRVVILITGSQGEPVSGLSRLARGKHPKLRLQPTDTVILSATPIPGNEATVWRLINDLMRRGANVVDHRHEQVHVSGHASREESALLFNLVRPRFAVPFHGEYRHMVAYGELAQDVGLSHEDVFLLQNGDVLRLDERGARLEPPVEHGVWTIDGNRINELGLTDQVVQDRVFLGQSGVISASLAWDFAAREPVGRPTVDIRGVRLPPDLERADLLAGAVAAIEARLEELDTLSRRRREDLERLVKKTLRGYFERLTGTYPVLQVLLLGLNEPAEPGPVRLTIDGEVQRPLVLDDPDLDLLADGEIIPLSALLAAAGVTESGRFLLVEGDEEQRLPLDEATETLTLRRVGECLGLQGGDGLELRGVTRLMVTARAEG